MTRAPGTGGMKTSGGGVTNLNVSRKHVNWGMHYDHFGRDFRVNEIKPIDPRLLDLLHELGGTLETDQPFHIISGYRSPRMPGARQHSMGAHAARISTRPASCRRPAKSRAF